MADMSDAPLYVSKRTWRSFWHEYRIYADRVDLPWIFGRIVIPAADIVSVQVRPPIVVADLFRGKGLVTYRGVKLDNADLCRHVSLQRRSGAFVQFRFTPDDPEGFVKACQAIMRRG
jgi:hypothetical protein